MGFTFQYLKPEHEYYAKWCNLHRRRRLFWISAASWFSLSVILALPLSAFCPAKALPLVLFFTLTVPVMAAYLYCLAWACPRCGGRFYWTFWTSWPLADRCLHCGLPEYAPNSEF
jgi:hypothetical protein